MLRTAEHSDTFLNGCQPWYGANKWTNWWTGNPLACPSEGDWFSYSDQGKGFGTNSPGNYWQCVPTDPGGKTGQVGDWMSVATKNCSERQQQLVSEHLVPQRRQLRREAR